MDLFLNVDKSHSEIIGIMDEKGGCVTPFFVYICKVIFSINQ